MISREVILARDFWEEAEKLKADWGTTKLFSTGAPGLDRYLGGGFGRKNAYEVVLIFGPTKIGKSTVGLNFVANAVKKGQRVGILHIEDDGPDVLLRLAQIVGKQVTEELILKGTSVHFLGPVTKTWKLSELVELIAEWYSVRDLDLILLDPIQMAFENAESIRGENEWNNQRVFMRAINALVRKLKKTIIIVSHITKKEGAKTLTLDRVAGSGGIAAACTKLLGVWKDGGVLTIQEFGSRFTITPDEPYQVRLNDFRLEDWNGKL